VLFGVRALGIGSRALAPGQLPLAVTALTHRVKYPP
jgi:hypothetical protein